MVSDKFQKVCTKGKEFLGVKDKWRRSLVAVWSGLAEGVSGGTGALPLAWHEVVQGEPPGRFVLEQPLVLGPGEIDLSEPQFPRLEHRDNSAAL